MSNGVQTAGTCISFSAIIPADLTLADPALIAAYQALTWTEYKETINFGDVGPVNSLITFETVCDGLVNKRPGPVNFGSQQLTAAWDTKNAAQQILWQARIDRQRIAARLALSSGDFEYYTGYVLSSPTQTGTAQDILRMQVNFEIDAGFVLEPAP